jgi:hypothetical protein
MWHQYSHQQPENLVVVGISALPKFHMLRQNLDLGGTHSIGAPIQVYPLYENGFRAARGQTLEENASESAALYEDFAKIASQNPQAWTFDKVPATANDIKTVSQKNRMICFPCMALGIRSAAC